MFSCYALSAPAQQLPLFTQYQEYAGVLNPAAVPNDFISYEKDISVGISSRKQWVTDKDGPTTHLIRADYVLEREGVTPVLGACLIADNAGRMGMTGMYLRAAMVFSDDPRDYGVSVGLTAGIVRYALDLSNAHVQNPSALAVYEGRSAIFPDVGIGVSAHTKFDNDHLLYGGLSVPQIMSLDTRFRNDDQTLSLRRIRHFYGMAGYRIPQGDEISFIEGTVWVRYVPPLGPSLDFNVRWQLQNQYGSAFYLGTGFGTNGNAHLEGGFLIGDAKMLRIGVGADLPFTPMSAYYGTSFEANVGYTFERRNR